MGSVPNLVDQVARRGGLLQGGQDTFLDPIDHREDWYRSGIDCRMASIFKIGG
jgi:hypothetical protein